MANRYACKPRPVCALEGCEVRVKRPTLKFCSTEHGHAGQARTARKSYLPKVCVTCGATFSKPERLDVKRWAERKACSVPCENRRRTGASEPRQAPQPVRRTRRPRKPPPTPEPTFQPGVSRELWRPKWLGRDVRPFVSAGSKRS